MRYFLALMLGIYSVVGYSQNFTGGLAIGINLSQVDGDSFGGFNKLGYAFSGFVNYRWDDRWAVQPELRFESLGSANDVGRVVETRHLSIPILAEYALPIKKGQPQSIGFHAGPVIGILLGADDAFNSVSNILDGVDFRGEAGADYRFALNWSFEVRYGYSLSSFLKGDGQGSTIVAPGKVGLFHNYLSGTIRWHIL
ncbi:porin family protein [Pontibacter sp. G13]|uniref:porin family protein n=1 Tax=Pontibacter sp. G13 TaxID=3074898 RepID=UPI00288B2AB5|nr:porin family protein [Pontibacter sp. G13]WNJ18198.1 porin family protein [Pontibacter sp. G13]